MIHLSNLPTAFFIFGFVPQNSGERQKQTNKSDLFVGVSVVTSEVFVLFDVELCWVAQRKYRGKVIYFFPSVRYIPEIRNKLMQISYTITVNTGVTWCKTYAWNCILGCVGLRRLRPFLNFFWTTFLGLFNSLYMYSIQESATQGSAPQESVSMPNLYHSPSDWSQIEEGRIPSRPTIHTIVWRNQWLSYLYIYAALSTYTKAIVHVRCIIIEESQDIRYITCFVCFRYYI